MLTVVMEIHSDSHQVSRLEVVERGRRRRWSDAEKLRIVHETLAGSRVTPATAQRHGISRQLLLNWRKAWREGRLGEECAEERLQVRREQSAPLVASLEGWLREQRARLSGASAVAGPIDYMLRRFERFARFIDDGRICLTNNAAERALRGFAFEMPSASSSASRQCAVGR